MFLERRVAAVCGIALGAALAGCEDYVAYTGPGAGGSHGHGGGAGAPSSGSPGSGGLGSGGAGIAGKDGGTDARALVPLESGPSDARDVRESGSLRRSADARADADANADASDGSRLSCGQPIGTKAFDDVVTFDTEADLNAFSFLLADNESPRWTWVDDVNPRLVEVNNVAPANEGAHAIYRRRTVSDGFVSVHLLSTDGNSLNTGGVILRYAGEHQYYRFMVNERGISIVRVDAATDGESGPPTNGFVWLASVDTTAYSWFPPGHTLKFAASGTHLSAYIDGALVLSVDDGTYSDGCAGIFNREVKDANFDDFEVSGIP